MSEEEVNEIICLNIDKVDIPDELYKAIIFMRDYYFREKEKNSRNKKIILDKLDKLKYGIENDFPITLGERQPLWEENKTNYISKDKIEAKIKELEKEIDKSNNNAQSGERYFAIELYKELMEE